jgi:hypothetical protein
LDVFTKVCYAGTEVTLPEKKAAYEYYKEQYKLLRARRAADKKKKIYRRTDYALEVVR